MNGKGLAPQAETVDPIPRLTAAVSPQAVERHPQSWGHREHAKEQGPHPRRGRRHEQQRHRVASVARQTLEPVSVSPTRAIAHLANKTALSAGFPVFPEPPLDKDSQLTPRA
jgi:hypothetical protein